MKPIPPTDDKTRASPLDTAAARLTRPLFNPDDYRGDLGDCDLTKDQQDDLLEVLWNIMSTFVAIGYGLDSVQLFSPEKTDEPAEKAGQDAGSALGQDHPLKHFNATAAEDVADKEDDDA